MGIPNSLSQEDRRAFAEINAYTDTITHVTAFLERGPNAGGQTDVFTSKKHQIIQSGGNKSGKSWSSVMKGALRSLPEKDIKGQNTGWLIDPFVRLRVPRSRKILAWISNYSQPVQQETLQPVIDDIFGPYIKNKYTEKGTHHWIETEHTRINFKWQTAEINSYTGANLDWAMLDEPHDRKIYYEVVSRFAKTKGYMWMALTPVIDAKDPDIARKMRYIRWMKEELIDPFELDPSKVPEVDVIYVDIEENPHVDAAFALRMWASMSAEERLIRKTGRFLEFLGASAFDHDQLLKLETYLRENPEVSQPRYGRLEYDDGETDDAWKIYFVETAPYFADEPASGWIWKIWEEPVDPQLGVGPSYSIGADPAEGKRGRDYTSVYIQRNDTGRVVAALHGYIDEIELARQLWFAGHYYCTRTGYVDDAAFGRKPAKLAVESVSIGKTTLAYLMTGHKEIGIGKYGLENLYRMPNKQQLSHGRPTPGTEVGWYTSAATRPHILTAMRMKLANTCAAIDNNEPCLMPDMGWVKEGKTFILNSTGKYEAASGFYDDRLFGDAICDKVVEQMRGRRRPLLQRQEEEQPKELYYYDENMNIVFNTHEAKKRAGQERRVKQLWY